MGSGRRGKRRRKRSMVSEKGAGIVLHMSKLLPVGEMVPWTRHEAMKNEEHSKS